MPRSSAGPGTVGALPPLAPRIGLAALAARVLAAAMRRLGRGGTALPGLVAETLAPAFVPTVARQLPRGVVLLTGTNGKTTTARMLAAILARDGTRFVHNAAGSNLSRGLASSLAQCIGWRGRLRATETTLGLFELDEAAFVRTAPALCPRTTTFLNLFRDQLDRYGEVDAVAQRWQAALAATPRLPQLILNADDPLVAGLGNAGPSSARAALYFGVDADVGPPVCLPQDRQPRHGGARRRHSRLPDVRPVAGISPDRRRFYAHLGHFSCPDWPHGTPGAGGARGHRRGARD